MPWLFDPCLYLLKICFTLIPQKLRNSAFYEDLEKTLDRMIYASPEHAPMLLFRAPIA